MQAKSMLAGNTENEGDSPKINIGVRIKKQFLEAR